MASWGMSQYEHIRKVAIAGADLEVDQLSLDDLLICDPTVQWFSLNEKQWRELAHFQEVDHPDRS